MNNEGERVRFGILKPRKILCWNLTIRVGCLSRAIVMIICEQLSLSFYLETRYFVPGINISESV